MLNLTALLVNIGVGVLLLLSFVKSSQKSRKAIAIAFKSFVSILPLVLMIIIMIGLFTAWVSSGAISNIAGSGGSIVSTGILAFIGSILFIPALVAFPLAASFFDNGFSVMAVAAFITTLTMIGTVTLPLEIRELGKKMALLRNGFSFVIAIVIAVIMGLIL